jgi:tRNA 2-thiouridine synthesizing protein E
MAYEVDGKTIECSATGFLTDPADWDERVAEVIAEKEEISLTPRHWDVINYLRDEYFNNNGNQPNMRNMVKDMKRIWNDNSIETKEIYDLFPLGPAKQAGKIGGLPESRRKGGY